MKNEKEKTQQDIKPIEKTGFISDVSGQFNEKTREVDFFGEKRVYSTNNEFSKEWNIKLLSNSQKEAVNCLRKMADIFEKSEEIDFIDTNGHFISKEVN